MLVNCVCPCSPVIFRCFALSLASGRPVLRMSPTLSSCLRFALGSLFFRCPACSFGRLAADHGNAFRRFRHQSSLCLIVRPAARPGPGVSPQRTAPGFPRGIRRTAQLLRTPKRRTLLSNGRRRPEFTAGQIAIKPNPRFNRARFALLFHPGIPLGHLPAGSRVSLVRPGTASRSLRRSSRSFAVFRIPIAAPDLNSVVRMSTSCRLPLAQAGPASAGFTSGRPPLPLLPRQPPPAPSRPGRQMRLLCSVFRVLWSECYNFCRFPGWQSTTNGALVSARQRPCGASFGFDRRMVGKVLQNSVHQGCNCAICWSAAPHPAR